MNRHVPIGWFTLLGDEHDSPEHKKRVRNLAVRVYDLIPTTNEQLDLFSSPTHAVSQAMDKINDRWGEFVVIPALMMGMEDIRGYLDLSLPGL